MIDTFFEFQIKGGALIAISVLIYFLVLSRDRSFHRNRVWLLSSLLIPWMVPLMAMPVWVKERLFSQAAGVNNLELPLAELVMENNVTSLSSGRWISWQVIAIAIYSLVSLVLLLRLFWGYRFLFRLMRHGEKSSYNGLRVIKVSNQQVSPFSFFRTIFIPDNLEHKSDKNLVLEHEKTHCDQWHSVDRSLVEWVLIFNWWNPFAWWLRKLIAQNHEYCVDNAMIRQTEQPKTYQYSLIHLMPGKQSMRLVNNFNRNLTKKRIVMMNKENTNRFMGGLKSFLMVALMTFLLLAFTNPANTQEVVKTQNIVKNGKTLTSSPLEIKNSKGELVKVFTKGKKLAVSGPKENLPVFMIDDKVSTVNEVHQIKVDDLRFVGFLGSKDAKKNNIEPSRDGAIVIVTKATPKKEMPDDVIYIVDGIEVTKEGMDDLKPESIESMNVLKNESAINKYGERAKNGVVEVTTKDSAISIIKVKGNGSKQQPLFIVDGEQTEGVEDIDPDEIEKIEILKGKQAVLTYGEEAKSGVVVVTSKGKNSEVETDAEVVIVKLEDVSTEGSVVKIKGEVGEDEPLYIIDGEELSNSEFKKVRPKEIKAMTVLKGNDAIEKYGDKGKNGVILIKLKD